MSALLKQRTCKDKNHRGKPCTNPVSGQTGYCNAHNPKRDEIEDDDLDLVEDDELDKLAKGIEEFESEHGEIEAIKPLETEPILELETIPGSLPVAKKKLVTTTIDAAAVIKDDLAGALPEIRLVPVEELQIDEAYQRSMNGRKVREIIKTGFNPLAAGTLVVNKRPDGSLFIIDGRHRREAARRSGVKEILCAIWSVSPVNESVAFVLCNAIRQPPTALELFKARLSACEPKAVEINSVVIGLNLKLGLRSPGQSMVGYRTSIQCIHAVERAYDKMGSDGLRKIISTIRDLWGEETQPFSSIPIGGLQIFFTKYPEVSLDVLMQRLSETSLKSIVLRTKQLTETFGGRTALNFARTLVEHYNKGLKNRLLPSERLVMKSAV